MMDVHRVIELEDLIEVVSDAWYTTVRGMWESSEKISASLTRKNNNALVIKIIGFKFGSKAAVSTYRNQVNFRRFESVYSCRQC